MSDATSKLLTEFQWKTQPESEAWLKGVVNDFLSKNSWAAAFAKRMYAEAGVRFHDCIGHICLPKGDSRIAAATKSGWAFDRHEDDVTVYVNRGGLFPVVVECASTYEIGLKVDSVADFLTINRLTRDIEGGVLATVRLALITEENGARFAVIERHGDNRFVPPGPTPKNALRKLEHFEAFRMRPRDLPEEEGFAVATKLIDAAIADLGRDVTCDLWFAAEREYWMSRNRAAQVQYARQCKLGIGWANHDHHTYRSSRKHFKSLVAVWEKLGLQCRERFYAGLEAGWGAQVMEQPVCGIITFNDVDLSPEELMGDFSHDGLPDRQELGTIGLWCGLHGEAFLQAGMHHLECMFDFDALRDQLEREAGIKTMKPFTDFAYLRQAFTEGERWAVRKERVDALLAAKKITREQAEAFLVNGAVGSHLENLERNEGFKGFNQMGVSEIIAATDPRKLKLEPV